MTFIYAGHILCSMSLPDSCDVSKAGLCIGSMATSSLNTCVSGLWSRSSLTTSSSPFFLCHAVRRIVIVLTMLYYIGMICTVMISDYVCI